MPQRLHPAVSAFGGEMQIPHGVFQPWTKKEKKPTNFLCFLGKVMASGQEPARLCRGVGGRRGGGDPMSHLFLGTGEGGPISI